MCFFFFTLNFLCAQIQVLINTVGFIKTRLVFLTRKPPRARNFFTIVLPLELAVWVAVSASLIVVPFSFWLIARGEEGLIERRLAHWSRLKEAFWYAFGTLIGESITRDTRSERAWGLRLGSGCYC